MKFNQFIKKAKLLCKDYDYKIRFTKVEGFDGYHNFNKKQIVISKTIDKGDPFIIHLICHEISHVILAYKGKYKKLHGISKCKPYWKIATRKAAISALKDERSVDKFAKILYKKLTGEVDKHSCYIKSSDSFYIKLILKNWMI